MCNVFAPSGLTIPGHRRRSALKTPALGSRRADTPREPTGSIHPDFQTLIGGTAYYPLWDHALR
eukprot:1152534-Pyramimonas_sp.AAC.1